MQISVDSKHKLIVDYEVTNNPTYQGNLYEMASKAKEIFGIEEQEVLADKGYYQAEDFKKCEKNNITTYVTKQVYSNATGNSEFYGDKFNMIEREIYIYVLQYKSYIELKTE